MWRSLSHKLNTCWLTRCIARNSRWTAKFAVAVLRSDEKLGQLSHLHRGNGELESSYDFPCKFVTQVANVIYCSQTFQISLKLYQCFIFIQFKYDNL